MKTYKEHTTKINEIITEIKELQEHLEEKMEHFHQIKQDNPRLNYEYGCVESAYEWYEEAIQKLRLANRNIEYINTSIKEETK